MVSYSSELRPGGALGYFLGGYVPPGTPHCIPSFRNGPIFYTPF